MSEQKDGWPEVRIHHDRQSSPESGWSFTAPGRSAETLEAQAWIESETYVSLQSVRERLREALRQELKQLEEEDEGLKPGVPWTLDRKLALSAFDAALATAFSEESAK